MLFYLRYNISNTAPPLLYDFLVGYTTFGVQKLLLSKLKNPFGFSTYQSIALC